MHFVHYFGIEIWRCGFSKALKILVPRGIFLEMVLYEMSRVSRVNLEHSAMLKRILLAFRERIVEAMQIISTESEQ